MTVTVASMVLVFVFLLPILVCVGCVELFFTDFSERLLFVWIFVFRVC